MLRFIESLRRRLDRRWFNWRCRHVVDTPLARYSPSVRLGSQASFVGLDVILYVLAAKSFARFARPREFVIVDDGLIETQRETFERSSGMV